MTGPDTPASPAVEAAVEVSPAAFAETYARTPLPPWAKGYRLSTTGGRPVLYCETPDGYRVWAQPKAWSKMTLRDEATGTLNYGIQLGQMQAHAGKLETNDSAFGRELLGTRTSAEVPLPSCDPQAIGQLPPNLVTVLVGGGLLIVAALIARRRKAPV